jgi:two-component system NarL family sensor kinase
VQVLLCGTRTSVVLTITDDGTGFDVLGMAQHPKRGIGLRNMHERMETVGGTLTMISSTAGTQVVARLPVT